MTQQIILASGSAIRAEMLRRAKVDFNIVTAKVDEDAIKETLLSDGTSSRNIADALAEAKARKVSGKNPEALVIGCDQVLDSKAGVLSKPTSQAEALSQLKMLRGDRHTLFSAAVIYENHQPIWRHVGQVRLWMRDTSDHWLESYVERNWDCISTSVGGYKLEEEGVRLFEKIEGNHFNVLGMPLLEILSYLTMRGNLAV